MTRDTSTKSSYLTAGELARRTSTTVRTLQYYDREGLLKPAAISKGGRRLYSAAEMVKLYQILSMKELGFSLTDIKEKLSHLDDPQEMAELLQEQAVLVEEKIQKLQEQKRMLELLGAEVVKMQSVNLERYADIVSNLRLGNELYPVITHMDNETLRTLRERFSDESEESVKAIITQMNEITAEVERMQSEEVRPDSPQAIALAKKWWELSKAAVGGDTSLMEGMSASMEEVMAANDSDEAIGSFARVMEFMKPAMEAYFTSDTEAAAEALAAMNMDKKRGE